MDVVRPQAPSTTLTLCAVTLERQLLGDAESLRALASLTLPAERRRLEAVWRGVLAQLATTAMMLGVATPLPDPTSKGVRLQGSRSQGQKGAGIAIEPGPRHALGRVHYRSEASLPPSQRKAFGRGTELWHRQEPAIESDRSNRCAAIWHVPTGVERESTTVHGMHGPVFRSRR